MRDRMPHKLGAQGDFRVTASSLFDDIGVAETIKQEDRFVTVLGARMRTWRDMDSKSANETECIRMPLRTRK